MGEAGPAVLSLSRCLAPPHSGKGGATVGSQRRKGWNSVFAREQVLLEEGGQGETTEPHGRQGQAGCHGLNDMSTQTHVDT